MSVSTQPADRLGGRLTPTSSAPATGGQSVTGRILRGLVGVVKWLVIAAIALITALLLLISLVWGPAPRAIAVVLAAAWIGLIFLLARGASRLGALRATSAAVIGLLLLSLVTVAVSQVSAYTPPIVDSRGDPVPGSIAMLETVRLNGSEQWITIRGASTENPVLLWLAGGPGGSQVSTVRWHLGALEKHFVVVNWEQPGGGKSYGAIDHRELSTERYIADGIALVNQLRERFGEEKVYLIGESWGSALGVWMVQRNPELFHALVSTGQMVDFVEIEVEDYQFAIDLAQSRGDTAKVDRLRAQGPPPYTGNNVVLKQAAYLADGFSYMNADPNINDDGFNTFRDLLSPEYGLYDKLSWARGVLDAGNVMFPQLWAADVDLRRDAPVLAVPVHFFIGRHDVNASPAMAEEYYRLLEAPRKEFVWFERSGHNPWVTESDAFAQAVVDRVLNGLQ